MYLQFQLTQPDAIEAQPDGGNGDSCCWETAIGQEMYKLTFIHLLAELATILCMDGGRWILSKEVITYRCCPKFNRLYNKWVCTVLCLIMTLSKILIVCVHIQNYLL